MTTTTHSSEGPPNDDASGHIPDRVCVVCRKPHPRPTLIRLVRRPTGRIGWPDRLPSESDAPPEGGGASPAENEKTKRVGSRTAPTGKGLYVCRGGDCLARLLSEKRFKKMFADSMEEECVARLSGMLDPQGPSVPRLLSSSGPKAKIEGRDQQ